MRGHHAARRVWAAQLARERDRQRLGNTARDVVLQVKEIAHGRLHGVRIEQRPPGRLDELRCRAQLVAGSEQCSENNAIDVGFGREDVQIGHVRAVAASHNARTDDERWIARQRSCDRVRETEREEVRFRIGPEDAKGQDDNPRQACATTGTAPLWAGMPRSSSAMASADDGRSPGVLAIALRITRSMPETAGEPVRAGGFS